MKQRGVRLPSTILFAAVCWLLIVLFVTSARAADVSKPFVIRNVRVFDGEKVIPQTDVAVADGKIVAIGKGIAAPPGAQVIDGAGDTLLPGLINSHVHIWTQDVLTSALAFGVTTELDMFMRWRQAQEWKKREVEGDYTIADFRTAGTCATVPHGHGTGDVGVDIPTITRPEEAQAFVDARVAEGSDYIKIMFDNGPRWPSMSRETMAAIVKAAHKRGKLVVVHAINWREVVAAGADGLAHIPIGQPPPPEFGQLMKSHHMFAISTLTYNDLLFGPSRLAAKLPQDPLVAPYLAPWMRGAFDEPPFHSPEHMSSEYAEEALRMLNASGVPVLAGTDSDENSPAGALMNNELELMVRAGLTPAETLADATSVPARIFKLPDRGTIAVGQRADLLLVRGDPTTDIRATRDIVTIWKQGVKYDRDAYRKDIAQKNQAWRFGTEWWPWRDDRYKGTSSVNLKTIDGGPDHSRATLDMSGEVRAGIAMPFAGVMYLPRKWGPAANFAGIKDVSFWSRGDGRRYWISLFTVTKGPNTPLPIGFIAGPKWEKHTLPLSSFGTDGHDVTAIFVGSAEPGKFDFQISDFRIGTGAWSGVDFYSRQISAAPGQQAHDDVVVSQVVPGSPADIAEIKKGDIVVKYNGSAVTTPDRARALGLQTEVGTVVPVEISRDGKHQTVQMRPSDPP